MAIVDNPSTEKMPRWYVVYSDKYRDAVLAVVADRSVADAIAFSDSRRIVESFDGVDWGCACPVCGNEPHSRGD
jgi:hypothetical protein